MDLSVEEKKQYQRHLSLPGFGLEGQKLLKESSVLVIGAGGLGCPALQYLAAAGVGKIGIVDDDIVEYSNLQRQILYSHNDIGNVKAEVAAKKLEQLNPFIKINSHVLRFNEFSYMFIHFHVFSLIVSCVHALSMISVHVH